jgi:hypothetical protein
MFPLFCILFLHGNLNTCFYDTFGNVFSVFFWHKLCKKVLPENTVCSTENISPPRWATCYRSDLCNLCRERVPVFTPPSCPSVLQAIGAHSGAVGWGTALQTGTSRVWFPMVSGIFHWHNRFSRTMALGSTQPLTEMSTGNLSWGVKVASA